MSQAKETPGVYPEQPHVFKGVLGEIVNDVQAVVKNSQTLTGEYRNLDVIVTHKLTHEKKRVEEWMGKGFQILEFLEEEQFTKLSPGQQRRKVYKFSTDYSRYESGAVLEVKLDELYNAFQSRAWLDRSAWENFVKAYRLFGARYDKSSGFRAYFPVVFETFSLELPSLTKIWNFDNNETRSETAKQNTRLQEELARKIGILLPEETLSDFIQRDKIKIVKVDDWKEWESLKEEDPGAIVGIQNGIRYMNKVFYEGIPYYYSVPTRYQGVRANIRFEAKRNFREKPLDESLNTGQATAGMELEVPTELFFSN